MTTDEILARLIAFPSISKDPNIGLITFVQQLLAAHGVKAQIIANESGTKANLYASVGPEISGGVMLSGHTDVVPTEGQDWSKPPFELTKSNGKYFGRGTADMKGFCASAIAAMVKASELDLKTPLHLALSYDEEIGCVGVASLIDLLAKAPRKPGFCIVGEPTELRVAIGHKGKLFLRASCIGIEGHSALAPFALNALHLAVDFVNVIRAKQADIQENGTRDDDYDVPYTTLHVGKITGGVALNIVPNQAVVDFEIRNLAQDSPQKILAALQFAADEITARTGRPEAQITVEQTHSYPGLLTGPDAEIVSFMKSLTGANGTIKVAFGTEGGLFSEKLSIPTVICGPGSMNQGHKPDEFISTEQLQKCDAMLDRLLGRLK